jgi:hypothetical protein
VQGEENPSSASRDDAVGGLMLTAAVLEMGGVWQVDMQGLHALLWVIWRTALRIQLRYRPQLLEHSGTRELGGRTSFRASRISLAVGKGLGGRT